MMGKTNDFDFKIINQKHFSSISLWGLLKKKPLAIIPNAHGMGQSEANWIDSIAVVKNTDLVASGNSNKLYLNLFKFT